MTHEDAAALQLLVSVREPKEAQAALSGGADWIDLKEPNRGPLGPVDGEIAAQIAPLAAGRRPITAAAGELLDWPDGIAQRLLQIPQILCLKVGLAGCQRYPGWRRLLREVKSEVAAHGKQFVLASYADAREAKAPPPQEACSVAANLASEYFLIDTWDKSGDSLPNLFAPRQLSQILRAARNAGVRTVVAGGLTQQTIDALPRRWIDVVGVRGAACNGGRRGCVSVERVRAVASRLRDAQANCQAPADR